MGKADSRRTQRLSPHAYRSASPWAYRFEWLTVILFCTAPALLFAQGTTIPASLNQPSPSLDGQSVTLLSNGCWLQAGGSGSERVEAALMMQCGTDVQPLSTTLLNARSGHSATLLPDGRVLIIGGSGADGLPVVSSEIVDPNTNTVTPFLASPTPRTLHTATLLLSGKILIVGGLDERGRVLATAELWDVDAGTAQEVASSLEIARYAHEAALLSSGETWLYGGVIASGQSAAGSELFDSSTSTFSGTLSPEDPRLVENQAEAHRPTAVGEFYVPSSAMDVPLDARIAVRFTKAIPIEQLTDTTITLVGPSGAVSGTVRGAGGGMLAFFKPTIEFSPASNYTLFIVGLLDSTGQKIPTASFSFLTHRIIAPAQSTGLVIINRHQPQAARTLAQPQAYATRNTEPAKETLKTPGKPVTPISPVAAPPKPYAGESSEDWIPQVANRHNEWRILGLPSDPPIVVPPLTTAGLPQTGQTGIAGYVRRMNGLPLAGVSVSVNTVKSTTDAQGRFILSGLNSGPQLLKIDGTAVISGGRHYTEHYIHVTLATDILRLIPDPIYLPRVDPSTEVQISSPANREIVLTHPAIPGLEVHIPKGAVLREQDGKIVSKVSITPIPMNRAPYPVAAPFSVYFTLQPGGAYVDGDPTKAIKIIYPNYQGLPASSTVSLWNYDPDGGGWRVYGQGKVSPDGTKVVPDESVGFRQIMTFGFAEGINYPTSNQLPNLGPKAGTCADCGDPVDDSTGLFIHNVTDMVVHDVIPIGVTRMYRQNDLLQHAFGMGNNLSYGMWLSFPTCDGCQTITLVLADGGQVNFYDVLGPQIFPYTNTDSPGVFFGATLIRNFVTNAWDISLRDGTVLGFTNTNNDTTNIQLTSITDRNGNQVNIQVTGNMVTMVTSPNGRYLQFFHDSVGRINQIVDNAGRSSSYSYDSLGRLASATGPDGYTESYGYDSTTNGMNLVTDKRGNAMVKNLFDANGRVSQQTLADGSIWHFSYVLNSAGQVAQATVTDPRNYIRQDTFSVNGYLSQTIRATGKPEQQTYILQRDPNNLVLSSVDPLSRETVLGYDSVGDITSVTYLAGTSSAVTYTMTYDPTYHQLTSMADPLGHQTVLKIDPHGNTTLITDSLGHSTAVGYNVEGLVTVVRDALGHTSSLGFSGNGDIASYTDALNRTTAINVDALGRFTGTTDPLGNITQYIRDPMSRVTNVNNALGQLTSMSYDQNGNLLTTIDPRNVVQTFTYDVRNRQHTYLDTAGKTATYGFDGMNNLTSVTDRKNQLTQIAYDGINRPTLVTFQDNSTIAITWDGGNRATKFVDSLNGTISRTYDLLDRLTQEVTPQGQVNYQYDAASRRQTMTVTGQPAINYTFDAANRLTQVAQGSTTLGFGFDAANRRTTVTLPNSVVSTYTFDNANELTAISYDKGSTHIGDLAYGYDLGSRRTSMSGSFSAFVPPTYLPTLTYDGTNRLTSWNGTALSYDADGNLTSFGATTYTWNARNQLTATSVGNASFSYDAVGRRSGATASGSTTSFLYDGLNPALIGTSLMLAGPGLDDIYARINSSGTTGILRDGLNNTLALSNSSAATTASYSYSPYGDTAKSGADSTTLEFTGRENDATNLYYYRARYYSPQFGRFIDEDPIGLYGGTNFYAYANGNPINNTDPLGLFCFNFNQFANDIEQNRFDLGTTFGTLGTTLGIGTMPKVPSELRGLGVPQSELNPYTSQLSRWAGRLDLPVLRQIGRTTAGIAASTAATAATIFEGFYDLSIEAQAVINASSSGDCGCQY